MSKKSEQIKRLVEVIEKTTNRKVLLKEAPGDEKKDDKGGDAAPKEDEEQPLVAGPKPVQVKFNIDKVKRYNPNKKFSANQGFVTKITPDGMEVQADNYAVVFVNFEDIITEGKKVIKEGTDVPPADNGKSIYTGTFKVKKTYDSISSMSGSKSTVKYDKSRRYQLYLDGKKAGPSFTIRNGKVSSTYGGDLEDYQKPIAQLLKSKGINENTIFEGTDGIQYKIVKTDSNTYVVNKWNEEGPEVFSDLDDETIKAIYKSDIELAKDLIKLRDLMKKLNPWVNRYFEKFLS